MQTLVVNNHKGGSAKTTTTVNLAAALAARGMRILVIDMDPQCSASSWLGVANADHNVARAISGDVELADCIYETTAPGVHLVPATPALVADASRHESEIALGFMHAMTRLPRMWDVVLVDCPPTTGYLAVAPLAACQSVLIPVEAHVMALAGLSSLIAMTDRIRRVLNHDLEVEA